MDLLLHQAQSLLEQGTPLAYAILVTAAAFVLACIALCIYALDRLGLWMEARGWIYYRTKQGSGGSVGNALLQMQSFVEPSVVHYVEEREDDKEEDHAGDPLDPGLR